IRSWRYGEIVTVDDPWGAGNSLEWATSCPPPRHNFTTLPRIRSERPAFELHHPHMTERMREEPHVGSRRRAASSVRSREPSRRGWGGACVPDGAVHPVDRLPVARRGRLMGLHAHNPCGGE